MKYVALALAGTALATSLTVSGQTAPAMPAAQRPVARTTPAPAAPSQPVTAPAGAPAARAAAPAAGLTAALQTETVRTYCATCHSDRAKAGGLSLASYDASRAHEQPAVTEKMIRKIRAGMMPPAGAKRPDEATIAGLLAGLETRMDEYAAANPNPGAKPFQRLNRAEYARAVKDLLGVDVDVTAYLPADTISAGFDNVADVQTFSATLMEGYLRAASRVSALAVGDLEATAAESTYRVPKTATQLSHVEGTPLGTRGGMAVLHTFPADGDYVFRMELHSNACGFLFGGPNEGEKLEVAINGERVALLDIDPRMAENTSGLSLRTPPIHVQAGPQRISAAFLQRFDGPVNDLIAPIDHTLADTQIGVAMGITTLPHLKDLTVAGPQKVTGLSDTPSRRKIFTCRPSGSGDERTCASSIVSRLAGQAFRRAPAADEVNGLLRFYDQARKDGDFEYGMGAVLEALLASPQFLFRTEPPPATARPGDIYRLADLDLANRLSFFLWSAAPDAPLQEAASRGRLTAPGALGRQVSRMLADPRAEALSTRFAAQWLRLGDVDGMLPDAILYPYFDRTLGDAMKRETELLFDSIVREDRSVLDLLTADYTFVNERLARHYGYPGVTGTDFRRVTVPDHRRGLLGQGSILVLTSVADRTSPVMRGKWVMEVMLGSPPPAPPPNVPPLDESVKGATGGRMLSVRERMEQHRANPACTSCHRVIDPLGLALENFDATGKWRIKDNGVTVDAAGTLYDGTRMDGPAGLRQALLKHQDAFLLSFTESFMTYALSRRIEAADMPAVRQVIRDAGRKGYRLSAFVQAIVASQPFQMNRVTAPETTTAPVAAH